VSGLDRLHAELTGGDALLAGALTPPRPAAEATSPASLAASGPRAAARSAEYELLVEAIYEGYLLHYEGRGRVVAPADPDLALLLGDQLFALGLARLAELGDLEAVAELGDVISLSAQARAGGDAELAAAVWSAGAAAVGWGRSEPHQAAKELARAGDPGAVESLRAVARRAQDQFTTG
jgi:hypothetical protein